MVKTLMPWFIWGLFFASSIFGHVALKRGAGTSDSYDFRGATSVFFSPWGIAALFSWGLSCWIWAVLLTKHTLFAANSVSTLRYVFLCCAAFFFLKETVTMRDIAGMALITGGVWLVSH